MVTNRHTHGTTTVILAAHSAPRVNNDESCMYVCYVGIGKESWCVTYVHRYQEAWTPLKYMDTSRALSQNTKLV